MRSNEFRAFLDLLMCSDPWPITNKDGDADGQDTLQGFADRTAREHGFTDWLDAYHRHVAVEA